MREHPILFSSEMVRAILDGRKTQTRRVLKMKETNIPPSVPDKFFVTNALLANCPYGVPGDLLWVRETWQGLVNVYDDLLPWSHTSPLYRGRENVVEIGYKADYPNPIDDGGWVVWVPSIHMPRWASRITLRVVDVRVERLQEISEEDAQAEGVNPLPSPVSSPESTWRGLRYVPAFAMLWNDINAARGCGWDVNPWVWVVEFERVEVTA